jgi:soluble lytic murein transglycosylase-like protein
MFQVADSALGSLASMPGYAFYRVASRDTLGRRSPRARVAGADCGWDLHRAAELRRCAPVEEALDVIDAGGEETGIAILQRWLSNDARFGEDASLRSSASLDWLVGAGVAYRAGRLSLATRWADQAFRAASPAADSTLLAIVPWSYPPAYDSLITVVADSSGIEPALLWATMRQESRFDPQVRSGSNAVGLMQLLLPAAQDAARWGGEPRPTDDRVLEDPATNLKWGVRYLARLIKRFDGYPAVALSAYNAGPSTVPPFWHELIEKGGEALFCEIASNADAQDYARRILAYRQAYRDLAPRVAR